MVDMPLVNRRNLELSFVYSYIDMILSSTVFRVYHGVPEVGMVKYLNRIAINLKLIWWVK